MILEPYILLKLLLTYLLLNFELSLNTSLKVLTPSMLPFPLLIQSIRFPFLIGEIRMSEREKLPETMIIVGLKTPHD